MQAKVDQATEDKILADFKTMQTSQDNEELQAEMDELTRSVTTLRQKLFDTEVELKINKMER